MTAHSSPRIQIVNWHKHGENESYITYRCFEGDDDTDVVEALKREFGWPDPDYDPEEAQDWDRVLYINDDITFRHGETFVTPSGRRFQLRLAEVEPLDRDLTDIVRETEENDSNPANFGACGDCPECGSLSPWRCGCDRTEGNEEPQNG